MAMQIKIQAVLDRTSSSDIALVLAPACLWRGNFRQRHRLLTTTADLSALLFLDHCQRAARGCSHRISNNVSVMPGVVRSAWRRPTTLAG